MDDINKISKVLEALLVVSEDGLDISGLLKAIPEADAKDIKEGIKLLIDEYDASARSFTITEIAGKFRITTRPEYMPWVSNLYKKDIERLTGASLETLAIIAYKQPATRAEVESIRGVNAGGMLKSLLEKGLLLIKGRKDAPGRPLMYSTTDKFFGGAGDEIFE